MKSKFFVWVTALTDAEKEALIHTMQDTVNDLQQTSDEIELLKDKTSSFMDN